MSVKNDHQRRHRHLRKPTFNAKATIAAEEAALTHARDAGREYHSNFPDKMLAEVSREGSDRYVSTTEIVSFLQGYIEARAQRDAFQRGE